MMICYTSRGYKVEFIAYYFNEMQSIEKKTFHEITVYPLLYEADLINRYEAFAHLPGFVLLESQNHHWGRYDILSALPYDRFEIASCEQNLASVFETFQDWLPTIQSQYAFPFQGGAIGYFSYDLGARLTNLHAPLHPAIKDIPLVNMGLYDWAIIADHHQKEVYLIAANHHPETQHLIPEILARWKTQLSDSAAFHELHSFRPLLSKESYQAAFEGIQKDLYAGRAYQVNYTQPFIAEYSGEAWAIYKQIRAVNPVPFASFLHFSEFDVISFSPERFILKNNHRLLTSPIKGSARCADQADLDEIVQTTLLTCCKNRAENTMIVDLMRHDFGKIALPGSVQVNKLCALQSYRSVHHLVSEIEASVSESVGVASVLASCFPGGSITGAPKRESMRIIHEYEPYARGVYCGSIGYFSNHGRFETSIAIRTLVAREQMLYLSAGGGIVIDSQCESEYQECYTKLEAIIKALTPRGRSGPVVLVP